MKNRGALISLVVFISIIIVIGILWFVLDDQRASLAQSYITKGEEQEKQGEYKVAYLNYKKSQIATPRSFAPYFKQANIYKKINQEDMAIKSYEKSIAYAKEEMAPTFALAKTYFEQKDYSAAKGYFERCFAFEPENSEVHFWIGRCQMSLGLLKEAQESLKTATELFPASNYNLYLALVLAYENLPKAQNELEKYYQSQDFSFEDFKTSNVAGAKEQEQKQIKAAFERMVRTESPATKKLILGQLLNQLGESGLAVKKLEELVSQEPKIRDAWVFLGYGYLMEDQPDQAIRALNKAKAIDPIHPLTFELLAKAYKAQDNESAARENLLKSQMLGDSKSD